MTGWVRHIYTYTVSINCTKKKIYDQTIEKEQKKDAHLFFFKYRIFEMLFLLLIIRHDTHEKKNEEKEMRDT